MQHTCSGHQLRVHGPNRPFIAHKTPLRATGKSHPQSVSQRSGASKRGKFRVDAAANGPSAPYNVVITGSTKGVGRALAEVFLAEGDNVCICSRSDARVAEAIKALQTAAKRSGSGSVKGTAANVSKPGEVEKLAKYAQNAFGSIDIWINNAGSNGYSYVPLTENNVQDLISIVETNTLGTMLCCREAIRIMREQQTGGHIFNMDGAGADGGPTPRFAAYGSTKRGLAQFQKSLSAELKLQGLDNKVFVHNLSPGMVTTELLMAGKDSSKVSRFFINALAEAPEDVAAYLVPRIRQVPAEGKKDTYIKFLTKTKAYSQIISRLLTGARKDRYVQEEEM